MNVASWAGRSFRREAGVWATMVIVLGLGAGLALVALSLARAGSEHPSPVVSPVGLEAPTALPTLAPATPDPTLPATIGSWGGLPADTRSEGGARRPVTIEQIQRGGLLPLLLSLAIAGGLVLLVASINLSLLLTARASRRRNDLATMGMLGATRGRRARMLFGEHLPLLAFGAGLAAVVATLAVAALQASWPSTLTHWGLHFAGSPLIAAGAIPFALAALAAVLPGLVWSERDLASVAASHRATPGPDEALTRERLNRFAIAAAVALLIAGGLLVRGFGADPTAGATGFDPADSLAFVVRPQPVADPADRADQLHALEVSLGSASTRDASWLSSEGTWLGLGTTGYVHALTGNPIRPGITGMVRQHSLSPGALTAAGATLLHGRDLAETDDGDGTGVVIVNRTLAARLFESANPVGRVLQLGGIRPDAPSYRVVGVVEDLFALGIGNTGQAEPAAYFSTRQLPPATFELVARHGGSPDATRTAIEGQLATLLPGAEITFAGSLDQVLEDFRRPVVWFGIQLAGLGAAAALLATFGLFALARYNAQRRTREIGIRLAIGATPRAVVWLLVADGLRVGIASAAWGIAGGLCIARLLQATVRGIPLFEAWVHGPVLLLVFGVALLGSLLPARAAAALDPADALRHV